MKPKCIAIIPARGGSKRIPNKNVKTFCGKPIIAYSIEAAHQSDIFEHVIVSTDSYKIKHVAEEYGAEVPFIRPPELSDDHTPTAPVVRHAIEWCIDAGYAPDFACCIYATAPFVLASTLVDGLKIIRESCASAVISVTTFSFPVQRAFILRKDGSLAWMHPEHELTRSQDLPEVYHDAGQFYWLEANAFMRTASLCPPDTRPVILPRFMVQDIDTQEDWEKAEFMYEVIKERPTMNSQA